LIPAFFDKLAQFRVRLHDRRHFRAPALNHVQDDGTVDSLPAEGYLAGENLNFPLKEKKTEGSDTGEGN
jgi:hypothetical protein